MSRYRIVQVSRENAHLVPDLVTSVYGYTYEAPAMYHAEQLLALAEARQRLLFLALDDQDRARSCMGLTFPYPTRKVGWLCSFMVDPAIRGMDSGFMFQDLAVAIQDTALELARTDGMQVLMSSEVTIHPLSQRYAYAYGLRDCGLYLAWCPAWSCRERPSQASGTRHRPNDPNSRPAFGERRAEVVSARVASSGLKPCRVQLPEPFADLLREIYGALRLPALEVRLPSPVARPTVIEERIEHLRSLAVIDVLQVGERAAEEIFARLEHHCHAMADLVHIHLPLFQVELDGLVQTLLARGCRFAALLPVYRAGDTLVLQYLNRVTETLGEAQLQSPLARRIHRTITQPEGLQPVRSAPARIQGGEC